MTKILLQYELMRKAADEDAEAISKAHSVYGFLHVRLASTLDRITVEYDASRLSDKDVESWLVRLGVPIRREALAFL